MSKLVVCVSKNDTRDGKFRAHNLLLSGSINTVVIISLNDCQSK